MQKVINVKLRSKLEGNFVKWRCVKRIIWEDCFHDSLIAALLNAYGSPSPGQPGSKAKSESRGNRADHILGIWNQTAEERVKILDIGPPALALRFYFLSSFLPLHLFALFSGKLSTLYSNQICLFLPLFCQFFPQFFEILLLVIYIITIFMSFLPFYHCEMILFSSVNTPWLKVCFAWY